MSYIHLTIIERAPIDVLKSENYSLKTISRILNHSISNISREVHRNKILDYALYSINHRSRKCFD